MADLIANIVLAALIAAPNRPVPVAAAAPIDVGCFRLMARFAGNADPRVREVGRVGAQYFLGRIDAAAPGFDATTDPAPADAAAPAHGALLRRCGAEMERAGHDFSAIGDMLEPIRPTA